MNKDTAKKLNKAKRQGRIRAKISGTAKKPRVSVFKSNKNIFIQFVDDEKHVTILSNKNIKGKGNKTDSAKAIGEVLGKKAMDVGITEVVFDRGGNKFHGRIKALADGLRASGLKF